MILTQIPSEHMSYMHLPDQCRSPQEGKPTPPNPRDEVYVDTSVVRDWGCEISQLGGIFWDQKSL